MWYSYFGWLWVGDSRLYRIREGEVEQLTLAHASGEHGEDHGITRALGAEASLELDFASAGLEVGD